MNVWLKNRPMSASHAKLVNALVDFRTVLKHVEDKSYFDLTPATKKLIIQFESRSANFPHIEAWTFIPHPRVIDAFAGANGRLERYVLTIDTQRSSVYEPVRDFLEIQKANISSYYCGGWADFLCDVQMDRVRFDEFVNRLRVILRSAGAEKFCPPSQGIDALISIFKFEAPLIVCGQVLENLASPNQKALEEVLADRVRFEMAFRNYRSPETIKLFGSAAEVQKYLRRLKAKGLIVCFKIVTDFSRFSNFDYVPMGSGHRLIDHLLDEAKKDDAILGPVRELFKVAVVQRTDVAEDEVTHIFINQYEMPGERKDWKRLVYSRAKIDMNLYNYPLEGPINESPIYLSDLPELLSRAQQYSEDKGMLMGEVIHPLIQGRGAPIRFPVSGLARHGVTFGDSGSGKTNADLVLISEASRYLDTIIILDDSAGIASKLDTLSEDTRNKLRPTQTVSSTDTPEVTNLLRKLISEKGILLLQVDKTLYPRTAQSIFKILSELPDLIKGNRPREIRSLLLIEEAADLFSENGSEVQNSLVSLLDQAYRKGWCIWLSLQRPTSLGAGGRDSASRLLKLLTNKIVYRLNDRSEVEFIKEVLKEAGLQPGDITRFSQEFSDLKKYCAIIFGFSIEGTTEKLLPPIPARITYLQPNTSK